MSIQYKVFRYKIKSIDFGVSILCDFIILFVDINLSRLK